MTTAHQLATRVFNTPLMIDPEKAAVIVQALGPRFLHVPDGGAVQVSGVTPSADRWEARPEAGSMIGGSLYRGVKKAGAYLNVMGVAVISITGTLVRRGSHVGESSGVTSYEGISAQIRAAAEDDEVRAIALEIDSFGGEAVGIFELMTDLRAAREAKPIHAFLAEYALSAGYAIASQADHITVPPFGKAGSIGILTMHVDQKKNLENNGIKVTLIHSGAHKVDGNPFEELPDAVRNRIQAESDAMWLAFAQAVAEGRRGKISAEQALRLEAAVFMGTDAVKVGLADEVSEARAAFERLVASLNPPAGVIAGNMAAGAITRAAVGSFDFQMRPAAGVPAPVLEGSSGCATGALAPMTEESGMANDVKTPEAEEQKAQTGATPVNANVDATAAAVDAERARADKISAKCEQAGLPIGFARKLINDKAMLEVAYDAILTEKAARAQDGGEINNTTSRATITGDVVDRTRTGITKALEARVGLSGGEHNEFTGMTLREMARVVLGARGVAVPGGGVHALASAAFSPASAGAMHSTSDFGNILADVANKSMLRGYNEADETFERFTSVGTLGDFKPTKRVGLDAFPSLLKVGEGAEFKYGTLGDHGETAVLATYGRLFAITRQTIINDDLDAFSRVPMKMGRAARRTVGDLVFAILTGNPNMSDNTALFHADHGNLAGSAGGPSELSINTAITAMATQKDRSQNATALNIAPAFLLAGPASRSAVLQALNSEYSPDDTAKAGSTKQPFAYNTVRDAAKPIFDARITGTKWFMAADPARFDTIEVSYLDGISTPFLDQQDGWGVDGTEFKVRLDAAATALAWEGLYYNAGS